MIFHCSIVKIIFKKFVHYVIFSKAVPLLHSFAGHAIMVVDKFSPEFHLKRVVF